MEPHADAVDRILLDEAATLLAEGGSHRVAVLDDVTGALIVSLGRFTGEAGSSCPTGSVAGGLRVRCDLLQDELTVTQAGQGAGVPVIACPDLDEQLLAGATLVILRLPKSLAALDEIAASVAQYADSSVRLLAGGRVKHMTHGMNRTLLSHFRSVTASLGMQKSRVLRASVPVPMTQCSYPRCKYHPDLDLTVCAHGGAFAGTSIDRGTRFLLSFSPALNPAAVNVADLGCGTGVLATTLARRLPRACVLAVDESRAACLSTSKTASANGVGDRVVVERADALAGIPDASLDLIMCNPPFHRGNARYSEAAFRMFAEAARTLAPGGELWTVYNSHLPYLSALRRLVGPTMVMGQDPAFLVTRSRR